MCFISLCFWRLKLYPKIIPSTRTCTSKAHHHEKFCIVCHCGSSLRRSDQHCQHLGVRFACLSVGLDKNSLSGTRHEVLLQAGTRIYHKCRVWASRHPWVCFARYLELHTLNAFVPLLQGGGRAPSSARSMTVKLPTDLNIVLNY